MQINVLMELWMNIFLHFKMDGRTFNLATKAPTTCRGFNFLKSWKAFKILFTAADCRDHNTDKRYFQKLKKINNQFHPISSCTLLSVGITSPACLPIGRLLTMSAWIPLRDTLSVNRSGSLLFDPEWDYGVYMRSLKTIHPLQQHANT